MKTDPFAPWRRMIRQNLVWVFLIALCLALVPMTLSHFVLKETILQEELAAKIINISGRQRMLSQRLTLMSNRIFSQAQKGLPTEETRDLLFDDIDLMRESHTALSLGSDDLPLTTQQMTAVAKIYFAPPHNLDTQVIKFLDSVNRLAVAHDNRIPSLIDDLNFINEIGPGSLLESLDTAVGVYEMLGNEAIKEIAKQEDRLWVLTAAILIAEFFLIFLPVHNLIRSQVSRLSENEEVFRTIYERSPIMLHSINDKGEMIRVSQFWLDHMGYERDEVIGTAIYNFMTPASQQLARDKYIPMMIETGEVKGAEYQFIRKNGELRDIVLSAQSRMDKNGKFFESFAALVDVTEERRLQAELEKSADSLQAFHKAASTPGLNHAERIRRVLLFGNVFFETSLAIVSKIDDSEYKIQYVVGSEAPPPEGTVLDPAGSYCTQLLNSSAPLGIEDVSKTGFSSHPAYTAFGLDTYIGIRLDVMGKPYGTINFTAKNPRPEPFDGIDLAFMRLLAQWVSTTIEQAITGSELDEAKIAAEAANATKSAFLANMSHEIRTPLNAVIGLTELTLKTDLTEKQKDQLTKVSDAGKSLLGIINDILDFSKIEAGKLSIETTGFALNDVLQNLAAMVSTKADENDVEILIWVDPKIPANLRGDPLRLGQILVNLLSNAIKFTERGEVVLRVDLVGLKGKDAQIKFTVTDTGIGMSQEQVDKLFKPFVQADQSTTRMFGGTGLGLTISKQLSQAMGGTIGVESEVGKGSTFTVHLPFGVSLSDSREKPAFSIDPAKVRVLIVDDNQTAREILSEAISRLGFENLAVGSGTAALSALDQSAEDGRGFDLILLDWQMPGMDGIETAQEIRQRAGYDETPTIFMISSYNADEVMHEINEIGVKTLLTKPINTSHLFDKMMEVFSEGDAAELVRLEAGKKETAGLKSAIPNALVLLVEDNELNRAVALGILENAGFKADWVENGKLAVQKLGTAGPNAYAAVLMDIQMPVMDGITATKLIRANDEFDELPIIAMTAHAMVEEIQRTKDAGMNDHIPKPVDAREVITKLNAYIVNQTGYNAPVANDTPRTDQESDTAMPADVTYDIQEVTERLMLPEEIVHDLLKSFVSSYADSPARLGALIESGDTEEAAELAHSVKGVTGNLGASALSDVASDIEKLLRNGDTETAKSRMTDFTEITAGTISSMQRIVS